MVRIIIILLFCLSCSTPTNHPSNCHTYKVSLLPDLNSATYCYGLEASIDLICGLEGSTSLCHSRGKYLYQVTWYNHTGEVYEFIDNRAVLTSYVSLEGDMFVYRRVDDNRLIVACSLHKTTVDLCRE